jgi:hypothetical protein
MPGTLFIALAEPPFVDLHATYASAAAAVLASGLGLTLNPEDGVVLCSHYPRAQLHAHHHVQVFRTRLFCSLLCMAMHLQGLHWLSVQAAEDPLAQRPLELGEYLWNGVEALTGLQELRMWLGFGVEGRQAQQRLVGRVEGKLHDCRCYVLQEPEKPVL